MFKFRRFKRQLPKARLLYSVYAAANGVPMKWDELDEATQLHWLYYAKNPIGKFKA